MISSCQHLHNNPSFTGILDRLIFDRVYDSWILSLLLFTLGDRDYTKSKSWVNVILKYTCAKKQEVSKLEVLAHVMATCNCHK